MKVIKLGNIPEDKVYKDTCKTCDTGVEFTLKSPKVFERESQRDGTFIEWTCPVCDRKNFKNE